MKSQTSFTFVCQLCHMKWIIKISETACVLETMVTNCKNMAGNTFAQVLVLAVIKDI